MNSHHQQSIKLYVKKFNQDAKINATGKLQALTLMVLILEIRILLQDFLLKNSLTMQKNLEEFL